MKVRIIDLLKVIKDKSLQIKRNWKLTHIIKPDSFNAHDWFKLQNEPQIPQKNLRMKYLKNLLCKVYIN